MKRILITGGAGFAFAYLTKELFSAAIGGANGELATVMRYSIHGFNCEDPLELRPRNYVRAAGSAAFGYRTRDSRVHVGAGFLATKVRCCR